MATDEPKVRGGDVGVHEQRKRGLGRGRLARVQPGTAERERGVAGESRIGRAAEGGGEPVGGATSTSHIPPSTHVSAG